LTGFGFAKDYDAIVKLEREGHVYQIALEYERTPKTDGRYADVRKKVEEETHLDCLLYLTPSYPLLAHVAKSFARCSTPVYFALADEFRKNTLDAMVMDGRRLRSFPLGAALDANPRRPA
jgi:hypothetical protein